MKDKQLRDRLFSFGILDAKGRPTVDFRLLEKALNKAIKDAEQAKEMSKNNRDNIIRMLGSLGLSPHLDYENIDGSLYFVSRHSNNDKCKTCGRVNDLD